MNKRWRVGYGYKELADHQRFKMHANSDVYLCDLSNPWQRGVMKTPIVYWDSILLSGTDISVLTQAQFNAIARQ